MILNRLGKNVGLNVALIILIAVMGFGCDLPPGDLHNNRPGEESEADNSSGETTETDVPVGIFPNDHSDPKYFEDPAIKYLEMEKHHILSTYGSPEDTGYYGGGYYLSYKEKAGLIFFFPVTHDEGGFASSVWITRGDIMDIQIGNTFEEIISFWGEPEGIDYDELESQEWGLMYTLPIMKNGVPDGLIWVVFFADSKESPTNYVSIKRELR